MLKKNYSGSLHIGTHRLKIHITLWLSICLILIISMILLGGATRLTESGLSIVEWKPITGIFPPLTDTSWQEAFEHYKKFPEYTLKHNHLTLLDFKFIFYMEYSHRLLGRILGLIFVLPLFFFWKKCTIPFKRRFILILAVGSFQGFMGWFMVKSGLVSNPYVSHFRLAAHLSIAFLLIALIIESLFALHPPHRSLSHTLKAPLHTLLFFVCMTIVYGAFVAGLRAGKMYNTFPQMGGEWIPSEWLFLKPIYLNFIENGATVQWLHRFLALLTTLSTLFLVKRLTVHRYYTESFLLFGFVLLQIILGALTVIMIVPIHLALMHQLGAIFLFSFLITLYCRTRNDT